MSKRLGLLCLIALTTISPAAHADSSVARQWNEELLEAIRGDFARPTVHARNLFHVSAATWDAWAAYDPGAKAWLRYERAEAGNIARAREEAISYAAYRLIRWRFRNSPGADATFLSLNQRMAELGYDPAIQELGGDSAAALGNRIAHAYIEFGLADGANEEQDYTNQSYASVNPPLIVSLPGNPDIFDPNRYQPLSLRFFFDQSGNALPLGFPEFLSPEWGQVTPFSLGGRDLSVHARDGFDYWLFHDPGPPPALGGEGDEAYKQGFVQVVEWSGLLDPDDGVMIDISPATRGDNSLGSNDGDGHDLNPATGLPYVPQQVPAGDYFRVLAEFWADGPDSETPPGHWFTIANYVSDHVDSSRRLGGAGDALDDLEWDVKLYLALGGAMHDVAIAAWGVKGWYDYVRPISAIRHMAGRGQGSEPDAPDYDPDGIPLKSGVIERVTLESTAPGGPHEHLAGEGDENIGKIAVYAWRGPDFIENPQTETAGVGWILAANWWPYQRPSFVTPPFAGYVSGHSTYSRAAAEVLTAFTGDAYFPGGLGEFTAPRNEFLVFEEGPSQDIVLQWATYRDAADECSLSRIYGGIHPPADDIPGRLMGERIGRQAMQRALAHFSGQLKQQATRPRIDPPFFRGLADYSGSWFDPQRRGEGWVIQVLDDRRAVIYWLSFDAEGNQLWLSGVARRSGNMLAAVMNKVSGPVFGQETDPETLEVAPWGSLVFTFRACDSAQVDYHSNDYGPGSASAASRRLTSPGLRCGTIDVPPAITDQHYSGSWYDPAYPGQGWAFEKLGREQALLYWMTSDADGKPIWLIGSAHPDDGRWAAQMSQPAGMVTQDAVLDLKPWGSVSLEFTNCDNARLDFASDQGKFGSGSFKAVRLLNLSGLECEANGQ